MQVNKVLNPQPTSKEELLFLMFGQDFYLKFLGNVSSKHLEEHGCSLLSSLYLEYNKKDNVPPIQHFLSQCIEPF